MTAAEAIVSYCPTCKIAHRARAVDDMPIAFDIMRSLFRLFYGEIGRGWLVDFDLPDHEFGGVRADHLDGCPEVNT